MSASQTVRRRAAGLFTHPSELEAPPGALLVADNAVIDREGTISKRPGFKRYGQALDGPALGFFEYEKRLHLLDGQTIKYDSDGSGTWASWAGTYLPPALGVGLHALLERGNVYLPTHLGVVKQDSLTGTPRRAGVPRALDLQVSLLGTGGDWFLPDNQVAYKTIWLRKDSNEGLTTGAPSQREALVNLAPSQGDAAMTGTTTVTVTLAGHGFSSGDLVIVSAATVAGFENGEHVVTVVDADTFTYVVATALTTTGTLKAGKGYQVSLEFTVPDEIVPGDLYEIYRTRVSLGASLDPDERYFRVRQTVYASGATISFTDDVLEDELDLALYTNDSEEGPAQSNDRPPHCLFAVSFKGHSFYANIEDESQADLQLVESVGFSIGDWLNVSTGNLTYTARSSENQALREFRLFTTSDPETPTLAQVVERTVKSLQKIVNRDPLSQIVIHYASEVTDPPGKLTLIRKDHGGEDPVLTASTPIQALFTPSLSTALTFSRNVQRNGVRHGKYNQPEHVPFFNSHVIGPQNGAILGVAVLTEGVFFFTEDGYYTLTGESDGGAGLNFSVRRSDPTVILKGRNSLVTLDNSIYGYTSQSAMRVTHSSSNIVSRPIESDLTRLSNLGAFAREAFGVACESERLFLLITPDRLIYCYNYLTNAWTRWLKDVSLGIFLDPTEGGKNRLYLAHATDPYVLEERKSLTQDDYLDETFSTVASGVTTATWLGRTVTRVDITYSYREPLVAGWHFAYGTDEGVARVVASLGGNSYRLVLDRLCSNLPVGSFAAEISMPIPLKVVWCPEAAGSAGTVKQFGPISVYLMEEQTTTHRLGFLANHQGEFEYTDELVFPRTRGFGVLFGGTAGWGASNRGRSRPVESSPGMNHQRCSSLIVSYENAIGKEPVNITEIAYGLRPYGSRVEKMPA